MNLQFFLETCVALDRISQSLGRDALGLSADPWPFPRTLSYKSHEEQFLSQVIDTLGLNFLLGHSCEHSFFLVISLLRPSAFHLFREPFPFLQHLLNTSFQVLSNESSISVSPSMAHLSLGIRRGSNHEHILSNSGLQSGHPECDEMLSHGALQINK